MLMEIAGQKIAYRDLIDLRAKLADLLESFKKDREIHDQESERIRKQEKSIQRFLGHQRSSQNSASTGESAGSHA
jgi:hypothetical protein